MTPLIGARVGRLLPVWKLVAMSVHGVGDTGLHSIAGGAWGVRVRSLPKSTAAWAEDVAKTAGASAGGSEAQDEPHRVSLPAGRATHRCYPEGPRRATSAAAPERGESGGASPPRSQTRNGMIRMATMFATLIIGLIAGPAVSL